MDSLFFRMYQLEWGVIKFVGIVYKLLSQNG